MLHGVVVEQISMYLVSLFTPTVFVIWQRGHGERVEREPIYRGFKSRAPSLVRRSRGRSPLKPKHFQLLNVQWKRQICPLF